MAYTNKSILMEKFKEYSQREMRPGNMIKHMKCYRLSLEQMLRLTT